MNKEQETVMLVDDMPANMGILFNALEQAWYKVLVVNSGEAALESASKTKPDIILLDVIMPGLDGFETCKRLKSAPETRDIPVIFMTILDETEDEVHGLELGAVDYITKPIQVERVLSRIQSHLTIRRLARSLEEKNRQLQEALDNIKTLRGLLPICSICKKIRDDEGYWRKLEDYIGNHTYAEFSHSVCPTCMKMYYPEFD